MRCRPVARTAAALGAVVVLCGCSVTTTSTDPLASLSPSAVSPSPSGQPSGTTPEALDLQLRPVSSQRPANADDCSPTPPPVTPPPRQPATLCSSDGTVVYELKPAAVAGDRVTSIEPIASVNGPIIQVKYDAMGGTALRTVTLAGSLADPQVALAIVSQGTVLGAPTMSEELDGGVLVISGFATLEQAQQTVGYIAR